MIQFLTSCFLLSPEPEYLLIPGARGQASSAVQLQIRASFSPFQGTLVKAGRKDARHREF